ncbi:hypothetical protein TGAMA5MH_02780 [Trichoderma gamsii]|uniref:Uncharacterized protein n=1 Tax=Trichoderma gamsii TaxID=398673 RepID=A0A2K0TJ90_9HYPO|nr:hypothetical protein TGAMA5MH_02780 [Trichoderma gamsii]
MAGFDLISSVFRSLFNLIAVNSDETEEEGESRQECRPLSDVHMPPPQDEGSGSDEEGESEEREFRDASESFEAVEVINMDDEYESGEEYLEESCLRLIVALDRCMPPTAQSMMTTARSMVPTIPAPEYSGSDLESISDYSDTDGGDSWSVIDER